MARHLALLNPHDDAAARREVTAGDAAREEATLVRTGPAPLPDGTVTFVLADVEGSVRLWEDQPDAMAAATAHFGALVSTLVARHNGARPAEQGEGDSFVAAFPLAHEAVTFMVHLQRDLHREWWATALPLRVRMAAHTGTAQFRDHDNYMGPTINRCARMRALAHGGQIIVSGATGALVADELGDHVTLLDLGLHALRDMERPEHIFQLEHPELPREFPPLRDECESARLPASLNSFVAREDEMKTIGELLQSHRFVTLTGAGGSGKTRLALETARREANRFPHGVAWADAAPLTDGQLLTSCVADALGVREVPQEALIDTIVREATDRHMLLVIDNCEHVVDDAARVAERLLQECPRLRLLATSREPLGVPGETVMRVPSLDHVGAVQLFTDRARDASNGFELTAAIEPDVIEVCRCLDGIPLAIELAAARVRVMTPGQIAAGLADRFRLLTGGSRTALPRQRTLEASVQWSYRLLAHEERILLDRLSVFSGGFSLGAVSRVCAGGVVSQTSVLDLVTALVDKSLLHVEPPRSGEESRYRMLETIRHFARERLADDPDAPRLRERHLAYFLEMAETEGPRISEGLDLPSLGRLEADLDNIRTALDWAEQHGDVDRLLRLAGALWLFFEVRCRFEEGTGWLHTALAMSPQPNSARAAALYGLGDLSIFTMDMATVATAGQELVDIGQLLADTSINVRGLTLLGWAACFGAYRDTSWACEALQNVLDGLSPHDSWVRCDALLALSVACGDQGDLYAAARALEMATHVAREARSTGSIQRAMYFLGLVECQIGKVAEAEVHLRRAIELADELDETFIHGCSLAALGGTLFLLGDIAGGRAAALESLSMGERYRNPFALVLGGTVLATILTATGSDHEARSLLEMARPIASELSLSWLVASVETAYALLDARRGDGESARRTLDAVERRVGFSPLAAGLVSTTRGTVERLLGDDAAAETAFGDAVGALCTTGAMGLTATALDGLAVSASRRERYERAARLFAAADAIRTELGIVFAEAPDVTGRNAALSTTRAALGDEVFAAETESGSRMTFDEAVRFARRGRGGRRKASSGWDSLTATELDVVRLVTDGLSNGAVAERLLMTRGTVKAHLSHIYTKTGVSSRAELAGEATRRSIEER